MTTGPSVKKSNFLFYGRVTFVFVKLILYGKVISSSRPQRFRNDHGDLEDNLNVI